ncbi:MAG: S9 family peptidase [Pseudomonadales bacterium]|nr:S9 family peptidase [Pseudomonadales bacterium]
MKAPFGSWKSPITSELIVADTVGISAPTWHQGELLWIESRPQEAGRNVLVLREQDGSERDINPAPFNIRTRVHEYGGGAWFLHHGAVFFSNFSDQHLYRQGLNETTPTQLTHDDGLRFANGCIDKKRNRIISVIEDHRGDGEAVNFIGAIDLLSGDVTELSKGHDFYAAPVLSPDGKQLAFMSWDHPDMPWDETIIWLTTLNEAGMPGELNQVAGGKNGEQKISAQQPLFSPKGELFFISDISGWWNLYRQSSDQSICPMEAEFGSPHWGFGLHSYDFLNDSQLVCNYGIGNVCQLAVLDIDTGNLSNLDLPYSDLGGVSLNDQTLTTSAASPITFPELITVNLQTGEHQSFKQSTNLNLDEAYYSVPETITFPTANAQIAHGFYYPPTNKDYGETTDNRNSQDAPPLVVMMHGGPTGATHSVLNLRTQFWTSRGFAVLDLNYRGSTGYGRDYRDKLIRQWGIVDVEDAVYGAEYLVKLHKADKDRLAIRGGSAGGYTTLSALTFTNTFKAGASHYGVGDLEALAKDTHKFESRYLDSMIGAYPDEIEVYQARSPIHHVDQMASPCIFFQGLEDKVVLPNQAETMVEALTEKGVPVAYVPFEGEQHGFRIAENIKRCMDLELYFYGRVFGFSPADQIEPIAILNLDS